MAMKSKIADQLENQALGPCCPLYTTHLSLSGITIKPVIKPVAGPTLELVNPNLHLTRSLADLNAH